MHTVKKSKLPKQILHWVTLSKNAVLWTNFSTKLRPIDRKNFRRMRKSGIFACVVVHRTTGYNNVILRDGSLRGYSTITFFYHTGEVKVRHKDQKVAKFIDAKPPKSFVEFASLVTSVKLLGVTSDEL